MVKRNPHISKLQAGYLFPEINKRKNAFLQQCPNAKLINLGIGNTTLPIPIFIAEQLQHCALGLSTWEGYSGYGPEQGQPELRKKIAEKIYQNQITADEIFVSDGAKSDIGRLQILFGADASIAVQDPAYPVYVDTSVVMGQTQNYDSQNDGYKGIVYMPCHPENGFFPDLTQIPRTDLIYFCSPNNPTGAVATHAQLQNLVAFAKKNRSIIIFDAAYSFYIRDPSLPKSIYEIAGAREVAIEVNSFSKMAGFTGIRLGWAVIPKELCFENGIPVRQDWERICTTFFNGASNIAQKGGIAALENLGLIAVRKMVDSYLRNADILLEGLGQMGIKAYGGANAPFIWAYFGERKSWEIFEELLEKAHIITTPGSGFGPSGEGFLRLSAFAPLSQVNEAIERLRRVQIFMQFASNILQDCY